MVRVVCRLKTTAIDPEGPEVQEVQNTTPKWTRTPRPRYTAVPGSIRS